MLSEVMVNGVAHFNSLPWQRAPWFDKSPIVLLTGSAGGGKSRVAAEKMIALHKQYPNSTGLILRKAREFCNKSVVPFITHSVLGGDQSVKINKSMFSFSFTNGSQLFWGGMKDAAQRESIRSIGKAGGLDWVWIEEANAFTFEDFQEILVRMRGRAARYTQIILSTNPDSSYHWINRELILGGRAAVYHSGAIDNIHNPSDYIGKLNQLVGIKKQRLGLGQWTAAEGIVFENYDAPIHLIDRFDIPLDWTRFISIDFGYRNPFVCQFWAINPDDIMFMYKEIYYPGRTVRRHTVDIKIIMMAEYDTDNFAEAEDHYEIAVCDHDAEDRATLEENGIRTIGADKDVATGIDAVIERLTVGENGNAGLYILKDSTYEVYNPDDWGKPTGTAQEIPGYVWEAPGDGKEDKERPRKINDHGCDDLRYATKYADSRIGDVIAFGV